MDLSNPQEACQIRNQTFSACNHNSDTDYDFDCNHFKVNLFSLSFKANYGFYAKNFCFQVLNHLNHLNIGHINLYFVLAIIDM